MEKQVKRIETKKEGEGDPPKGISNNSTESTPKEFVNPLSMAVDGMKNPPFFSLDEEEKMEKPEDKNKSSEKEVNIKEVTFFENAISSPSIHKNEPSFSVNSRSISSSLNEPQTKQREKRNREKEEPHHFNPHSYRQVSRAFRANNSSNSNDVRRVSNQRIRNENIPQKVLKFPTNQSFFPVNVNMTRRENNDNLIMRRNSQTVHGAFSRIENPSVRVLSGKDDSKKKRDRYQRNDLFFDELPPFEISEEEDEFDFDDDERETLELFYDEVEENERKEEKEEEDDDDDDEDEDEDNDDGEEESEEEDDGEEEFEEHEFFHSPYLNEQSRVHDDYINIFDSDSDDGDDGDQQRRERRVRFSRSEQSTTPSFQLFDEILEGLSSPSSTLTSTSSSFSSTSSTHSSNQHQQYQTTSNFLLEKKDKKIKKLLETIEGLKQQNQILKRKNFFLIKEKKKKEKEDEEERKKRDMNHVLTILTDIRQFYKLNNDFFSSSSSSTIPIKTINGNRRMTSFNSETIPDEESFRKKIKEIVTFGQTLLSIKFNYFEEVIPKLQYLVDHRSELMKNRPKIERIIRLQKQNLSDFESFKKQIDHYKLLLGSFLRLKRQIHELEEELEDDSFFIHFMNGKKQNNPSYKNQQKEKKEQQQEQHERIKRKLEDLKYRKEEKKKALIQLREKVEKLSKIFHFHEFSVNVEEEKDKMYSYHEDEEHSSFSRSRQQTKNNSRPSSSTKSNVLFKIPTIQEDHFEDVENQFLCPITFEVMNDPVILVETSITYERKGIEEWLKGNQTCPITRKVLSTKQLIPNITLRSTIQEWMKKKKQMKRNEEREEEPSMEQFFPEEKEEKEEKEEEPMMESEENLKKMNYLKEMGFSEFNLNKKLLRRFNGNIMRVIESLLNNPFKN